MAVDAAPERFEAKDRELQAQSLEGIGGFGFGFTSRSFPDFCEALFNPALRVDEERGAEQPALEFRTGDVD